MNNDLNQNYYRELIAKYDYLEKIIKLHNWIVGGNIYQNIESSNISMAFKNEILNPQNDVNSQNYIGLMYISDYGYAAFNNSFFNQNLYDYSQDIIKNNNWLFNNLNNIEWTITPRTNSAKSYFVDIDGKIYDDGIANIGEIRPCFYLTSNSQISSGIGKKEEPYRLYIE